jgi:RHS repeat-associated protein
MTFTYYQQGGAYVPLSIQYTAPSGSTTFPYQVSFDYTTKSANDTISKLMAGSQIQQTEQLANVTVTSYGIIVREYVLNYSTSATTLRATLTSIQECANPSTEAGTATDCLPATAIVYQGGAVSTEGLVDPNNSTGSGATNGTVYSVDVNGDGYQDLVFAVASGSSGNYEWWVQFASAGGYAAPVNTGAATLGTANFLLDDFDATGGTQILAVPPGGTTWYAYKWNAASSSFVSTATNVSVVAYATYSSADVDGDGRPDLVYVFGYGSSFSEGIQLNNSAGGVISFVGSPVINAVSTGNAADNIQIFGNNQLPNSAVKHFDFDGDGRQDLMISYNTLVERTPVYVVTPMLSRGTNAPAFNGTLGSTGTAKVAFFAVNWNDDQCTDLIEGVYTLVSACNGNAWTVLTLPHAPSLALDWDGDGRTDVLANVSGAWEVYRSEGNSVAPQVAANISLGSGTSIVTDQNGDGLDDIVLADSAASNALFFGNHRGANTPPDLATSFVDAYGNSVGVEYVALGSGATMGTDQVFPNQSYMGPIYIAVQLTYSDPSVNGATYYQHLYYSGGSTNLQGRGFAGFGAIQTFDSRSGTWDTKDYNQTFPYTGTVRYEVLAQDNANTKPIHIWNPTWAVNPLDATAYNERYFPYVSPVVVQNNEVGGPEDTAPITSTTRTTTYDNYGNAMNVSTVTTDEDTNSPYYGDSWTSTTATTIAPDTTTWCLNVPTYTEVTNSSTAPGGAAITRSVSYTPDYAACRVTGKVTAPGTSYEVSEVYGFDAFGNLSSDAVTGLEMSPRTTGINWGKSGQFPTVITDALGRSITLTYDPFTGNPSTQTDPNSTAANPLQTRWTHDDFGRKTRETRPDGTYTTWAYNNCATWGGCLLGSYGLAVVHEVFGKNAALIQAGTTDYDALNRPVLWNELSINNTYDLNEVKYDNLGRIVGQAEPCAWGGAATTLCPYWITNQYDVLNRLTRSQRPISATNSTLQTTTYGYAGRSSTIQDALGHTTTQINTVTGQMARSIDANGYYQNFVYDAFGSLTAVTDSAANALFSATYAYGIGTFQTASSDMDMGSWLYTVDPLGEVTAHMDAKGQRFSQSYDALSRPLIRTEPDLTTTFTWGASAASYDIGKLASVTAESAVGTYSDTYTYDSLGRPSTEVISNPGDRTYAYVKTYDPNTGFLASLQYPVDISFILTLQYAYSNGILQSVSSNSYGPSVVYWTANATNPRGQVTQETLGNGVVINRSYDAVTGWLGGIQAGAGGGAGLQNNSFLYDEDGNLTQRQANNQGLTENFYYDALNRLSYSTLGGAINLQMTYDAAGMGNIAARSDLAGGASWTYDPVRKHAVTQAGSAANTYSYDANGNAVTRNGYSIGWTSYNYPGGVSSADESVSFQYGPDRQRWQELYSGPNGVETTYRAGKLFEVAYYGGLAHYRHYVYAGNELVSIDDRSTASTPQYYVVADHQGSIASIIGGGDGESCPAGYTPSGSNCTETLSQSATASSSCPAGYTLSGSSCVDAASSTPATVSYSCPTGYSLSGTTCSETVTAAAAVSYSCPAGYSLSGTECSQTLSRPALYSCSSPAISAAASSPASGVTPDICPNGHYYCPAGWTINRATCYETLTQAATLTYSCPAGYALSGTACSATLTQAAAASYACPAGDTLSGSTCSETVPATVSYSCPAGYSLSGSTCSETLTVAATGSAPSLLVPESFTPYGLRRSGETWSGVPTSSDESTISSVSRRGYTQQTALGTAMGLNHMNGRIQDATTGRFLSPDPYVQDPFNTQNFNRYSYVNNNPLSFTDPSGFDLDPITVDVGLGGPANPVADAVAGLDAIFDIGELFGLFGGGGPTLTANQMLARSHGVDLASPLQSAPTFQSVNGTISFATEDATSSLPNVVVLAAHSVVLPASSGLINPTFFDAAVGGIASTAGVDPDQVHHVGISTSPSQSPYEMNTINVTAQISHGFNWWNLVPGWSFAMCSIYGCEAGNWGLATVGAIPFGSVENAGLTAARGGLAAVRAGQAGEAAVRAAYNIGPKTAIDISGRTRIPDGLLPDVLSEVKNVGSLSYTQQLRDFTQFSLDKGLRFDLYVRSGAELSGPLQDAIDSGFINLLSIPQ